MILLNYVSDAADGHYAKVGAKHGPGNRVTEVMKRHFKGEPGATDKGTVDPKKVNWV